MALKLITAAASIMTLAEVKRHCRVDHADDDDYLEALVASATAWIDGKDGWLGRAVGSQTWDYVLDEFPCGTAPFRGGIRLPLPPLQSVTYIKYVDPTTELETTLATDQYEVDTYSEPGWVMPGADGWPTPLETINAVRIRFVAGYATVPPSIKHAILLLVGHWYENREDVGDAKLVKLPLASEALLMPHRNWHG